jgi:acetyl-CoA carboxylase biotin carboxyl carrier protein
MPRKNQGQIMAEPKGPNGSGDDGAMRIDPALVQELAQLLIDNALTEIEVEDGDRRVRVKREAAPAASAPALHAPVAAAAAAAEPAAAAPTEEISGFTVKSPMVGTAFMSPEPGAAPFVQAGDAVKAGDTLLIVEAMKVMNPITAPEGGVIKKILVADAQPVEFDQPLVIIG